MVKVENKMVKVKKMEYLKENVTKDSIVVKNKRRGLKKEMDMDCEALKGG